MAKTPRAFVPLDMNYMRDPAIRRAGPDAELLYIRSLAYCKSGNTEGDVYDYDLDVVGVGLKNLKQRVDALVREELWTPIQGGWHIRSWFKWNWSREEIEADRARKADGANKTNHERYHKDQADPNCSRCASHLRAV